MKQTITTIDRLSSDLESLTQPTHERKSFAAMASCKQRSVLMFDDQMLRNIYTVTTADNEEVALHETSSDTNTPKLRTQILAIQNCTNRSNINTGLVETDEDTLGGKKEMLGLVNTFTGRNMDSLVNLLNAWFVSVNEDLPRLRPTHPIFDIKESLPAKLTISVSDTELALDNIKVNKATDKLCGIAISNKYVFEFLTKGDYCIKTFRCNIELTLDCWCSYSESTFINLELSFRNKQLVVNGCFKGPRDIREM